LSDARSAASNTTTWWLILMAGSSHGPPTRHRGADGTARTVPDRRADRADGGRRTQTPQRRSAGGAGGGGNAVVRAHVEKDEVRRSEAPEGSTMTWRRSAGPRPPWSRGRWVAAVSGPTAGCAHKRSARTLSAHVVAMIGGRSGHRRW